MRRFSLSLRLRGNERNPAEPSGNPPSALGKRWGRGQRPRGVLSPAAVPAVRTEYARRATKSTHTRYKAFGVAIVVAAAFLVWAHPGWAAPGDGCKTKRCKAAVRKEIRADWADEVRPHLAWLKRVEECETRDLKGRARNEAVSASGLYRGRLQFSRPTWQSVGGRGHVAGLWGTKWAEPLEQRVRAVRLMKRDGRGQWPVCG